MMVLKFYQHVHNNKKIKFHNYLQSPVRLPLLIRPETSSAKKRNFGNFGLFLDDFLSLISPPTLRFVAKNWYRIEEEEEERKRLELVLGNEVAGRPSNQPLKVVVL